ncbi:hypothetical protein [Streptomyces sp. NPDC050804]|uniref:hypothetical protein n=1 Tax=Streptomyces sp. NPDC050804 TaxID=3154745 RepID=UPI00342928DC
MSIIVEFFVAPDDASAALALGTGPERTFEALYGLVTALARAERFRLHEIAASWVGRRAEDGEVIEADVAGEILSDLAALARSAARQRQGLYCWVA